MLITFYVAAAIAIVSTVLMITRLNAVHALLYLVVSLLAVAIGLLHFGRAVRRCAGSDHLRGRHHGPFHFRDDDAKSLATAPHGWNERG